MELEDLRGAREMKMAEMRDLKADLEELESLKENDVH